MSSNKNYITSQVIHQPPIKDSKRSVLTEVNVKGSLVNDITQIGTFLTSPHPLSCSLAQSLRS